MLCKGHYLTILSQEEYSEGAAIFLLWIIAYYLELDQCRPSACIELTELLRPIIF